MDSLKSMTTVEASDAHGFHYTRFEFESTVLGKSAQFGVVRPQGQIRGTVCFLHGGDGDDQQWQKSDLLGHLSDSARDILRSRGLQILLPSIGLSFLNRAETPSTWDHFRNELLPAAEEGTSCSEKSRWLVGISMGGHAALNAFLQNPELFAGCGTHFPGITDFDPFNESEALEYQKRTGISDSSRSILVFCFNSGLKNARDCAAHDPIQLLAKIDAKKLAGKRIYVDVGRHDEYGLFAGARAFHQALEKKGIAHRFEEVEGKHDMAFVQQRLTKLLSELLADPASPRESRLPS